MSDITHLHIKNGYVACTHDNWGADSRWVKDDKKDVTCKVCLKVKPSTIKKRLDVIRVQEVMES